MLYNKDLVKELKKKYIKDNGSYLASHSHRPVKDAMHAQNGRLRGVDNGCSKQWPKNSSIANGKSTTIHIFNGKFVLSGLKTSFIIETLSQTRFLHSKKVNLENSYLSSVVQTLANKTGIQLRGLWEEAGFYNQHFFPADLTAWKALADASPGLTRPRLF